ncbi:hypothetical protein H2200_010575 [Cladophialophora chaetospira]|uniref:NmrA-like domain-containing protein n=1 Tax=Cladophialophora chaetospira TaxID=386627 RepID=A0AA38X1U5_9EURO|nr:hypothetical protein H2200_010575 [Cladophialophora chaetospira]
MSSLKRILITGATGKQGGALLSALLKSPPPQPFHLVALTRNSKSPSALALAKKSNVSVVEGDLNNCEAIFKASPEPFHGVFSVQVPMNPKVEEQQGKSLIDAAAANGVSHFIYTSADRGGVQASDRSGTAVKHFHSKFNIEKHLKQVSEKAGGRMKWTIIRPVAFMENLTPDFLGRAFASMWQLNGMDSKLQLVSSVDIGILAAHAFKDPDNYTGKAISFATDELTPQQANDIFKKVMGTDMPTTYSFLARTIKFLLYNQLGAMFDWFKSDGFGANPREYTDKFPEMQNFETWLKQSSKFTKPSAT